MLSNAVNYSKPPRKIRISYLSNPQEKMHRLAIHDNGVGITNSKLMRSSNHSSSPTRGT